jgi:hypothetical protein
MKIAMVGANDPLTFDDMMRLDSASCYLPFPRDDETLDIINLNHGRDFLAEHGKYGIVILHSIFHTNLKYQGVKPAQVEQSPYHSIENWRKRLSATAAKIIVVWELLPASLNGWQLNDLDGYKIHHRDTRITVYKRKRNAKKETRTR